MARPCAIGRASAIRTAVRVVRALLRRSVPRARIATAVLRAAAFCFFTVRPTVVIARPGVWVLRMKDATNGGDSGEHEQCERVASRDRRGESASEVIQVHCALLSR